MGRSSLALLASLLAAGPLAAQQPAATDGLSRPMLALQTGHGGIIQCIAFSPDDTVLATGGADGAILWDVATRQPRATLPGAMNVVHLAFSPDGATLATVGVPNVAALWDVRTGRLRANLQGNDGPVYAVAFSADGATAVTGGEDGSARLWDVHTGKSRAVLGHPGGVWALALSPDGKTLAAGYGRGGRGGLGHGIQGGVCLWEMASGRLVSKLGAGDSQMDVVAFSPDGSRLVMAGEGRPPTLWEMPSGRLVKALGEGKVFTHAVAFSPDGRLVATADISGETRLWDGDTGAPLGRPYHEPSSVGPYTLAFSPDGRLLASLTPGRYLQLWDVSPDPPALVPSAVLGNGGPRALAFSRDGKTLATAGLDASPRLWEVRSRKLIAALPGQSISCFGAWLSPDGRTAATGSVDGKVRRWDLQTGQLLTAFRGPEGRVLAGAFSHDGSLLATSHVQCTDESGQFTRRSRGVRLWSTRADTTPAVLDDVTGWICPGYLAFSPDDTTLEAVAQDGKVYQWDVASGKLKVPAPPRGTWSGLGCVAWTSDGKTMAARHRLFRGLIDLLDPATQKVQATLECGHAFVLQLAFSGDGKLLAALLDPGKVAVWDLATRKALPVARDTDLLAFAPEMAHPVSPAGSGFRLYDPITGREEGMVLAVQEPAQDASSARPIEAGAKAVRPVPEEWFVTTPEGFFDCSAGAAKYVRWNVNGRLLPAERYMRRFRRPDLVRRALAGERLTEQPMTLGDIPPAAGFVGLKDGDPAPDNALTFTVEARDDHDIKDVELLLNDRPPTPDEAKPIEVGAKPIDGGAKPIELGAKTDDPAYSVAKRFTFRVTLPKGAQEVHVRAVAYDDTDLGSDPVEIALRRAAAQEVLGDLYVLSVGVSKYQNSSAQGFRDLRYPSADARAVADRFQQEGKPIYGDVHACTLTDDQATLAAIRDGLAWLTTSVRPGQVDTAVIFLSGHGVSDNGRYFFAPYDLDRTALDKSALSGQELREALGGKLRAKAVFLFVDACHAGGLSGRSDDLALELGDGVFLMASCGSREYSYESADWGHGAFTYALLRALGRKELARNGVIYFNALTYAVPDGVAELMTKAGRNESEEEPCIPLAARRLRVPLAHVPG